MATISQTQQQLLEQFTHLFVEYTAHTNISAIRDYDGVWQKHVLDSLELLNFEQLHGRVLDIGTGGGVPGMPLAIMCPDAQFVLLDSGNKKIKACEYFIEQLGLKNVTTVHDRAENYALKAHDSFDYVLSRATAYLPKILNWSSPFVSKEGKIILYKSPSEEELTDGEKVLSRLKLEQRFIYEYTFEDHERQLRVYGPQL
jgi:16S rRNA (guanine527-N7)-methyltransferase